ncbi:MAG TPA: phosphoglycerate kinase [Clostridiales bacterium]|nr:phosphoglycerate kinase [Clostridiales bacterium]HBR07657.1 phosphoglycerate kinase [Clostridiales bacterium]
MEYNKQTIRDFDPKGKKVLLRCDFNVPQDKETGEITSDKRIVESLPTIRYLLQHGAAVIACSHLGKPKGEWKKSLSLAPVAVRLSELLGKTVIFAKDIVGEDAAAKAEALKAGEILLLENLRFDKREEKNGEDFAKALAAMADVYVSDAFGTVHRPHASTAGVSAFLPAYAGLLLEKEISIMGKALEEPARPFIAILGGAKVSDKIGVINNLLGKADTILIGGAMAFTFIKAMGNEIGSSLFEADKLDYAKELMKTAAEKGVTLLLPEDVVIGRTFDADTEMKVVAVNEIPDGWMGMDIGPKSIEAFTGALKGAGTIVWNGPMGVFEFARFSGGTKAVAQAVATSGAVTIIGGGDSAAAVEQSGFADRITHISTGGGASLEFLAGISLPGVACLLNK